MNERQKKIMVPHEEKTDTCPDCSNHPCDCGMPVGYTPTPWTDANEEDGWNPCGWAVDSNLVRELERELAAVTEQLEEAKQQINIRRSNNLRLDRITREQQELIENLKRLGGTREQDVITLREITSKAFEYKEQRDRLAEALNKYRGQVDNKGNHSAPEAIQSLNQNVKVHTPLPATASDETGVKP